MSSITLVTEPDASLPMDVVAEYGIRLVPINGRFGEETLRTGVDMENAALFARVDREGRLPTTSAPAPGQFAAVFQAALDTGDDQVEQHVRSRLLCPKDVLGPSLHQVLQSMPVVGWSDWWRLVAEASTLPRPLLHSATEQSSRK